VGKHVKMSLFQRTQLHEMESGGKMDLGLLIEKINLSILANE